MPPCLMSAVQPPRRTGGPWRLLPLARHIPQRWLLLLFILSGTCFLPGFFRVVSIQAALNSTAVLPCDQNITPGTLLTDLRVYWQRGDLVLYVLNVGSPEPQHQNEAYLNRTSLDHSSFYLSLSGVWVTDEGLYTCHIQKKEATGFKPQPHFAVQLTVAAAYSQPVISQEKVNDKTKVNLMCQSQGGYPQPTVVWYNLTGQCVIPAGQENITLLQDPWSQQYNVSSRLVVEVSPELSVVCSVQSLRLPAVNSTQFKPDITPTVSEPDRQNTICIVALIVFITVILFIASCLVLKKCGRCSKEIGSWSTSYTPPVEQRSDSGGQQDVSGPLDLPQLSRSSVSHVRWPGF